MRVTRQNKVKAAAIAIVFIPMILLFHYGHQINWRPDDWVIVVPGEMIFYFLELISVLSTGAISLIASALFYGRFK
tara:strand:+ start:429 stop:656 length:228 start_codon:yes stop_codon:yes gene_type:complete